MRFPKKQTPVLSSDIFPSYSPHYISPASYTRPYFRNKQRLTSAILSSPPLSRTPSVGSQAPQAVRFLSTRIAAAIRRRPRLFYALERIFALFAHLINSQNKRNFISDKGVFTGSNAFVFSKLY